MEKEVQTVAIELPPRETFTDRKVRGLGDLFDETGIWSFPLWRQSRSGQEAFRRLSVLDWNGKTLSVRADDLKMLATVLLNQNITGPGADVRRIVRMFGTIAIAADPVVDPPVRLEDLDLTEESDQPPANGAPS